MSPSNTFETFQITPEAISKTKRVASGFSLVELLVVVALIGVLAGLLVPAFNSFSGAGSLGKASSDISGILEQARAYAMGRNTYVYVGIQEVDVAQPSSSPGIGRVAVAVVASQDGARPYVSSPGQLTTNIAPISKLQYFDNIHLADASSLNNGQAMLGRPSAAVDLGTTVSTLSFHWPLGSGGKYNFTRIIEFDPQGAVRVQTGQTFSSAIKNYVEIALVPTRGNVLVPSANQSAIQIDGVTGAIRVYKP